MARRPRRDCIPCQKKRQKFLEQVAEGKAILAAKTAVTGIGMMIGAVPKTEQKEDEK